MNIKSIRRTSVLGFALGCATLSGAAFSATWKIDTTHSVANFRVKHLMVTWVRGTIAGITGTIDADEKDFTKSKVVASLDASTINSRDPKRDEHLKSPDFLNVQKYPTIKFVSKSITGSPGKFKLYGALTLNGVTKDVSLDVDGPTAPIKSPWGDQRRGLSANTSINRKDFNIVWNKALDNGGLAVGDDIGITIDLELTDKMSAAH